MNAIFKMELEKIEEIMDTVDDSDDIQKPEYERFKIKDLEGANWVFRNLKAIEEKKREIEELAHKEIEPYHKEIERIIEWKHSELESFDKSISFFNFLLEEYYREQRALDPKFKLSTPYGKVISRKQQPKWIYEEDRLLGWLKANDLELVRIKEEVNKAELKKKYKIVGSNVVTEDGEIVEGVTIEERDPSITIKVEV